MQDPSPYRTQETVKICIVNSKGDSVDFECATNLPVDEIKITALKHFFPNQLDSPKASNCYKMVSIGRKKTLVDEASIRDNELSNGDILLLLEKFSSPQSTSLNDVTNSDSTQTKVTEAMIDEATKNLKPKNMCNKVTEYINSLEFQSEIRKILISLVDYSEKLLRHNKDISPILKSIKVTNVEDVKKKDEEVVDQDALKQLVDMGFAVERSKRALILNNMSPLEAMDWLFAYETSSAGSSIPSSSSHQVNYDNTDIYPKVPLIVEAFRTYKRKHFKPNMKHFNNLKQLGYSDNEILDALWIHSNNEVLAGEWLLKERRPKSEELLRGLKSDSPIYKAVIKNPVVQLGLVKPKVFFAFLQLIEEPNSTAKWLNDVETQPVIAQIFNIYHSWKYAPDDASNMDCSENETKIPFQSDNQELSRMNSD